MAYRPECPTCDFFHQQTHRCTKHSFTMPSVEWYTLCSDWQRDGQQLGDDRLHNDHLYYYSAASSEFRITPLAPFTSLQNLIVSVAIREDAELGWVILPRTNEKHFPSPGLPAIVHIEGESLRFEITNAERKLAIEPRVGSSKPQAHTQAVTMLHYPQQPDLLYQWLNSFVDMASYHQQKLKPGLFAFVEVLGGGEYAIYPDMLVYDAIKR